MAAAAGASAGGGGGGGHGTTGTGTGGGGSAGSGSAGSGGDSGGGANGGKTLKFDDLVWESGRGRSPVITKRVPFGTVYAGRLRGEPVALKAEVLRASEGEAWMKAARFCMSATSPHIVAVRGTIVDREFASVTHFRYLVMERLADTVSELLLTPGGARYRYCADIALRLQLLGHVAGGLAYLHNRSLVYMDPRLFDPGTGTLLGIDVCSVGVLAWQVLTGRTPREADTGMAAAGTMSATAIAPQMAEALRRHVLAGSRPTSSALGERAVLQKVVRLVASCRAMRRWLQQAALPVSQITARVRHLFEPPLPFPVYGAPLLWLAALPAPHWPLRLRCAGRCGKRCNCSRGASRV